MDGFGKFESKMKAAGLSQAAIDAFRHSYQIMAAGETGCIPESTIKPVANLPRLEQLGTEKADAALLSQTVVLKLNGGLGTGMGLEKAKSLLEVKDGLTFLDLIARQILHLRRHRVGSPRFLLLNSFSTSADTLAFLKKYPELGAPGDFELMQNQVPKVDARTLEPVSWPQNPTLEWCPPGHGDLYSVMLGSGRLESLLAEGFRYLFVSNSDNLGATLEDALLIYFVKSGLDFLMEVAERTPADRKGGHLAERGGRLLLREAAQCPPAEEASFQDISRHSFFNTNSLWIRLESLRNLLAQSGGFLPLPLIKNSKTVNPREKSSTPVFQLESAMGAAIELFPNAGAIVVPRTRFAPVKTTSDLLVLRSDACTLTPDWRIVLSRTDKGPPAVDLDPNHYKLVDQFENRFRAGIPSLQNCEKLVVRGPVDFSSENRFAGSVLLKNSGSLPFRLPPGEYANVEREFS